MGLLPQLWSSRHMETRRAHLSGAYVWRANLRDARPDSITPLPDGTKWTPDADLTRFTDPDHPDFWRADDLKSPAYRGQDGD